MKTISEIKKKIAMLNNFLNPIMKPTAEGFGVAILTNKGMIWGDPARSPATNNEPSLVYPPLWIYQMN